MQSRTFLIALCLILPAGALAGILGSRLFEPATQATATNAPDLTAAGSDSGLPLEDGTPTPTPDQDASHLESSPVHPFDLTSFDTRDQLESPSLAIDHHGRVYLAWASQLAETTLGLQLTTSTDGGQTFQKPRTIHRCDRFEFSARMRGREIKRSSRLLPHLSTQGDRLYIAWVEGGNTLADVSYVVAYSDDGGETISAPTRAHASTSSRASFTGFASGPNGTLVCTWLDARNRAQQLFASMRRPDSQGFAPEQCLDAGQQERGVCPCCPTSSVIGENGTAVVAYRNSVDGYRDIWITQSKPNSDQFLPPRKLIAPRWEFKGCPHDGPTLALQGDHLYVAWMDAHSETQRIYLAQGPLSTELFEPLEIAPQLAGSQSHPSLAVDSEQTVHVVWDQCLEVATSESQTGNSSQHKGHRHGAPAASGRAIMYAQRPVGAKEFSTPQAVDQAAGVFQSRPAIALGEEGEVYVSWNAFTETGKQTVVRRLAP